MKTCTKCGQSKPLADFRLRKDKGVVRRRRQCDKCWLAGIREWAKKNPEKTAAAWRKHDKLHPVERRAFNRQYYRDNPEKWRALQKRKRDELQDGFVRGIICYRTILCAADIPDELVILKRGNLKLKRLLKNENKC